MAGQYVGHTKELEMEDKIREEFKKWMDQNQWVTADEAFEAGYKARDEQVKKLREALAKINNQRKNQDSYKLLVNIFEIANNALKAEELDK